MKVKKMNKYNLGDFLNGMLEKNTKRDEKGIKVKKSGVGRSLKIKENEVYNKNNLLSQKLIVIA